MRFMPHRIQSDHDYYFYVAMPDGSHLFATTNSEHERNKEKAAEAFAEAANSSGEEDTGE